MFLRNYWYVAAFSHEVGSEPLGRTILNEPVALQGGGTRTRLELLMSNLARNAEGDDKYMRLLLSQIDKIDRHPWSTTATEESPDASDESE